MFEELIEDIDRAVTQAETVLEARGIELSGRILVGLSGGADSSALLHCVSQHLGQRCRIQALHANHQLHPSAQGWADHCRQLCQDLRVTITIESVRVDTKGNLEAAARRARYDFFARHMERGDVLMLAHHGQDQLETVLMRLFQGRGVLPMRRHGNLGSGVFVRPFVAQDKSRLLDYLVAHGVAWIDDPSNGNTTFDRNFLRNQVLPQAYQRWPSSMRNAQRSIDDLSAQQALLAHYASQVADEVALDQIPQGNELGVVWLRTYLAHRKQFDVSDAALLELLRQGRASGRATLNFGSACLQIWQDSLYFEDQQAFDAKPVSEVCAVLPTRVLWYSHQLDLAPAAADDTDAIAYVGDLKVTCRDLLVAPPAGVADRLKRRFQQAGIPPWRRGQYPLLWDDVGLLCIPQIWRRANTHLSGDEGREYCAVQWVSRSAELIR